MKAYLTRLDPERQMARFYRVMVLPTLFGEWSVVREWGRIGQGGTVREEVCASEVAALELAGSHLGRKRRRGYRDGEESRVPIVR